MLEIDTLPDTARLVAYRNDWNDKRSHLLYELPNGEAVLHDLAKDQMFLEQAVDVALKRGYWVYVDRNSSED